MLVKIRDRAELKYNEILTQALRPGLNNFAPGGLRPCLGPLWHNRFAHPRLKAWAGHAPNTNLAARRAELLSPPRQRWVAIGKECKPRRAGATEIARGQFIRN